MKDKNDFIQVLYVHAALRRTQQSSSQAVVQGTTHVVRVPVTCIINLFTHT